MSPKKLVRLSPLLLLALMSCVSSNPTGEPVAPMDIGGVTTEASGLFHVITAADRASNPPQMVASPYQVVHHFASIPPVPAGQASSTSNTGSNGNASGTSGGSGGSGASGTTGGSGGSGASGTTGTGSGGGGASGTASATQGVSTYAGTTSGFADGAAGSAKFNAPVALAVDGSGNVYVADTQNDCIRKITTTGQVSTFAGVEGQPGFANAQGTSAKFNQPTGLAFDSSGNLYVADSGNELIRKIDSGANVTTFAGVQGQTGSANGDALSATFNDPYGLVFIQGTLYVSDAGNNLIRAIASGKVTTLAGSGTAGLKDSQSVGTDAEFSHPEGLAMGTDASGTVNVYVADTNNGSLRAVSVSGVVITLIGDAQNNRLGSPGGVAVVGHTAYITNSQGGIIQTFDLLKSPLQQLTTPIFAGNGATGTTDGTLLGSEFDDPEGIAGYASDTLFVADKGSSRIRKLKF